MKNNHSNAAQHESDGLRIALAGNPNAGKTSIFNALTGARQHVGNYPGVTVDIKEGLYQHDGQTIRLIDLPGTYSLTAYSPEELIARDFILHDTPAAIINILDASNLERNLYLAVQILELGIPTVLALNMSDVAAQRGIEFDLELLQQLLGVPIVATVGHKGQGNAELMAAAVAAARAPAQRTALKIDYGPDLEDALDDLTRELAQQADSLGCAPPRWVALKLLEGDQAICAKFTTERIAAIVQRVTQRMEALQGDTPEALIADRRYGFISGACKEAVRSTAGSRHSLSDKIDAVVTNRLFGIPIFLGLMYLVFQLTFTLGDTPMEWIEDGFAWLGRFVAGFWAAGSSSLLKSLLVDGIIAGVGGVLVFLPNILLLFLAIAILEDSGYMARAAFLMDRLMHKIGLHGKSFVPMLIGFGCSVPAIMATRTLENKRDRLTTMLVVPLMSCGARLPIYALIIPAFFPEQWHAPMLWLVYTIGIVLAIFSAKLLKMTILRGETPPFVMELPPYRMPTARSVGLHMWNRGGAYLKKAGTIILMISIVLWALQQWPGLPADQEAAFDRQRQALTATGAQVTAEALQERLTAIDYAQDEATLKASLMGRTGQALEPLLRPCGFDWKISTAMIGAFAAKEVFVTQMGIVYSLGGEQDEESLSLRQKLQAQYTPLVGFCIMLFCLISAPCMATIAITRRESNSWKWALFQLAGLTIMAWVATAAVYQLGRLLGF